MCQAPCWFHLKCETSLNLTLQRKYLSLAQWGLSQGIWGGDLAKLRVENSELLDANNHLLQNPSSGA